MAISDKFLALYKEYESLVRSTGQDPKDIENSAEGLDADRLRLCRQFRNYFAHVQDPGFLEPSDKMLKYLQQQVDRLKSEGDVAKKHLKKPDACMVYETDKLQDALAKFQKLKCLSLLVLMKDGSYAQLSIFDTIGLKPTAKVSVTKLKPVKPIFCDPLDAFMSLDTEKVILCTDTGKPDGKLLGRVWG